jgi:hypothetical protein
VRDERAAAVRGRIGEREASEGAREERRSLADCAPEGTVALAAGPEEGDLGCLLSFAL